MSRRCSCAIPVCAATHSSQCGPLTRSRCPESRLPGRRPPRSRSPGESVGPVDRCEQFGRFVGADPEHLARAKGELDRVTAGVVVHPAAGHLSDSPAVPPTVADVAPLRQTAASSIRRRGHPQPNDVVTDRSSTTTVSRAAITPVTIRSTIAAWYHQNPPPRSSRSLNPMTANSHAEHRDQIHHRR